jgi:hypothetical protein
MDAIHDQVGPAEALARRESRAVEIEDKTQELIAFHEAGVLTDAELEEQKVRLRWNIGR